MITQKTTTKHPRFDQKVFEVAARADALQSELERLRAGQPRVLADVILKLSKGGRQSFTGARLRGYLEANKRDLFPGTTHRDVLRIFQIYKATLVSHHLIREAA